MNLTLIIVLCVTIFLVSLVLLYLPKIIKFFKKVSSKKKSKKKKKKKQDDKVKASKVVEQIRPVVKPKDEKKAKEETKDIESKKKGTKSLNAPEQKAIDFKYSANRKKSLVESIDEYDKNNTKATKKDNYNPYSITTGKGNPLNRDIKKEFEDIRKFLDLPENQTGGNLQKKYEQTKSPKINSPLDFSKSKKIDASLFNEPSSHYADYRDKKNPISFNDENLSVMRTNTKYSKPVPYEPVVEDNGPIKGYTYKIDRKKSFLPTVNKNLNYDNDEYLNFEEENIDLNKLSPKLKRMIITNILKRKNFD